MTRIALLNPNTDQDATRAMVAIAAGGLPPGISIEGHTVPSGVPLITTETALRLAVPAVVATGISIAAEGVDGIIVAGFGEPGLEELRSRVRTKVAGIAEAGMTEAARLGPRFSIITTTPNLLGSIRATAARYGFSDLLASVRCTPGEPGLVMSDHDGLAAALLELSHSVVREDGAAAILVGGGPLGLAARAIAPQMSVPLVEPVLAAAQLMRKMVFDE